MYFKLTKEDGSFTIYWTNKEYLQSYEVIPGETLEVYKVYSKHLVQKGTFIRWPFYFIKRIQDGEYRDLVQITQEQAMWLEIQ